MKPIKENKIILIVDDESTNVLLLSKMLSMSGYTNIITTTSPLETFELYKNNNIDLVILDINMPEMNGYDVLKELQGLTGFDKTKVIAASGNVYGSDVNSALKAGFIDYITKPMRMQDVLNIVDKALGIDLSDPVG